MSFRPDTKADLFVMDSPEEQQPRQRHFSNFLLDTRDPERRDTLLEGLSNYQSNPATHLSPRLSLPRPPTMPQYTSRDVGDPSQIKKNKQSMADLKLRRLTELNNRLREDLDRERIPVSTASKR